MSAIIAKLEPLFGKGSKTEAKFHYFLLSTRLLKGMIYDQTQIF